MKIETFNYMKIIFISCFFISNSVFARSPITPDTFINITTNKEFALVMIPRKGYNLTGIEQSGLYKTSDLKKPIWTLDWYETNLISNIDGKFLVRFGSWYSSPKQVGALSFYMNGKLIKSYYIDDLVKIPPRNNIRYPHTRGSWIKKREYMEGDGVLYLKTIENNEYVFSIFTGESIEKQSQKYENILQKVRLLSNKEQTRSKDDNQGKYDTNAITNEIFNMLPNTFTGEDIKLLIKEFAIKRVANKTSVEFNMLPRILLKIIRSEKVKKYECEDNKVCFQKL